MGVYIKGMDMPTTHEVVVHILPDGTASIHDIAYTQTKETVAVEVPKHGRLIDADVLPRYTGMALSAAEVARAVEDAPTVIEREE